MKIRIAIGAAVVGAAIVLSSCVAESWDYVVLGGTNGTRWAAEYGDLMESDLGVEIVYHDYYEANQKVSRLLWLAMNNEGLRNDIKNAEVITIGIGFSDILETIRFRFEFDAIDQRELEQAVEEFRKTYNSMLSEIVSIASPNDTIIRIMDFYFLWVGRYREKGIYASTKRDWMKFNECISEAGDRHGIPVAHVFEAFNGLLGDDDPAAKGYLLADDIYYASQKGEEVIAEEFRRLGYERGQP